MPSIFDILDYDFWNQSFYDEEDTNQALQKLSSLNAQQIQDLKAAYQENPFLFLRFNNKMLDELKKLGIDIVVNQDDQNKIFAITVESLMKQYDEILWQSKSYFEYVTGDGYCQTYATVQAFGLGKITQAEAKKIRQEIAEALALKFFRCIHSEKDGFDFKSFDEIPEKLLNDCLNSPTGGLYEYKKLMGLVPGAPFTESAPIVNYFSKKYKKPAWNIAAGAIYGTMIFSTCNDAKFQDILYDCPVVCLNGVARNHSINLKADRAERKKFALEFYNLFRDAIIASLFWTYNFVYNGADLPQMCFGNDFNFKNNFYEFTLPGLLNGIFKKIDIQQVITQLENFFNGVPHKYKNMIAIKLMFYIFDEYKTKILEPFDINMPEDKFITANEFLSEVLENFRTENLDKDQDIKLELEAAEKKEDNKNMEIDFDEILKKYGIGIGNHISFKDQKFDYLKSENNDLFNNFTDDVPTDGNCTFRALIKALKNKNLDEKEIISLREEVAEWCKKEYGWDDNYKYFIALRTPGKYLDDDHVYYLRKYLSYKYDAVIFDFSCYCTGSDFYFEDNRNKANLDFLNLKDSFFSVINGACCVVGSENHSRVLKLDPELRKKFYLKFFDLYMIYYLETDLKNYVEKNKSLDKLLRRCTIFLNRLFFNELLNNFVLKDQIEELIKSIPDELKIKKLCELAVFTYKKFKTDVLEKENKDITADEFYSSVFKEFKEKYIDNDPDLKQNKNTEENKEEPSIDSESEQKKDPDLKSEQKINPEPQNISGNQELKSEQITGQITQKPEGNKLKNDQEIYKPEENTKKDETQDKDKDKDKPKSKKQIFSGPKWLYIFLCVITFGIIYFFLSSPERKENKPLTTKDNDNKDKNNNSEVKKNTDEDKKYLLSKSNSETRPLSGLNSLKSNRADERVKNTKSQFGKDQNEH